MLAHLFATPPHSWWQRLICRIINAKTFHWGWLVCQYGDDWITSESTGKGTTISRLGKQKVYFYRVKGLDNIDPLEVLDIHSKYGLWKYDWNVIFRTAVWWLVKHYLGKMLPRHHDKEVNCQEWVVLIAKELGVNIISDNEYPCCHNLEQSLYLEHL